MKKKLLTLFVTISFVCVPSGKTLAAKTKEFTELSGVRQALISAGLGAEDDRYHARPEGEGFLLASPAQGLTVVLGSTGVEARGPIGAVTMRLLGWGCGSVVAPATGWDAGAEANRVEFVWEGITEWYVAGPLGVEQGFTVVAPAAGCEAAGDLVIELAVAGSAVLSGDARSLDFLGAGLRYRGLVSIDAAGRELPARLELSEQRLVIHTAVAAAQWPVTVDPIFEVAKLLASDGDILDHFGRSVAVSDGTVVVGASQDDDVGSNSGSAYVFTEPEGGWAGTLNEAAKLLASDGAQDDNFGYSVAVSGRTIVIGAFRDDDNGTDSGSAYVFTEPGGGWAGTLNEAVKLLASDGAQSGLLGLSVAISGSTIVLGAPGDDDNGPSSGSAYVFTEPGGGWAGTLNETAKLLASDGLFSDALGSSVAISGGTIVLGAGGDDDNGSNSGSAYVFTEPDGGWAGTLNETAKLLASDGAESDRFGSVAVSGSTIVVGAVGDDDSGSDSGSAYVFTEPSGGWAGTLNEAAKLLASDGDILDQFGLSVAISGGTVVTGADRHDDNGQDSGSAYVFTEPGGGWAGTLNETAELLASDGAQFTQFGFAVGVSDGTIVIGAVSDSGNSVNSGSAYVALNSNIFTDGFESGDTSAWSGSVP